MRNAYLLTWNPQNWDFEGGMSSFVAQVHRDGSYLIEWAVSNGQIQVDDIVYLMKIGTVPRGIIARGVVIEGVHLNEHYDIEKARQGIKIKKVTVSFTSAVELNNILDWNVLRNRFPNQKWTPQSSGVSIKNEYIDGLEDEWLRCTDNISSINTPLSPKGKFINDDGDINYVCGRCSCVFLQTRRCPECGQIIDSSDSMEKPLNDRKILKVGDDISGLRIYEIINKYFGQNYKGWMKAMYDINDRYAAWFPTITSTNERPNGNFGGTISYSNTLSSDRKTILEMNHDAPNGDLSPEEMQVWGKKLRLVFGRINGNLEFLGVFQTHHVTEAKVKTFRHVRVSRGIDLSSYELVDED